MSDVLQRHVDRFNSGVRTGVWGPMLEGFSDDAELEFRGVPIGPFIGKEAIEAAYREQPPDDELQVLEQRTLDGRVEARYAWLREADVAAGEIMITARGGKIEKLIVTFDRGVAWS